VEPFITFLTLYHRPSIFLIPCLLTNAVDNLIRVWCCSCPQISSHTLLPYLFNLLFRLFILSVEWALFLLLACFRLSRSGLIYLVCLYFLYCLFLWHFVQSQLLWIYNMFYIIFILTHLFYLFRFLSLFLRSLLVYRLLLLFGYCVHHLLNLWFFTLQLG
jgi:hypothetical protein